MTGYMHDGRQFPIQRDGGGRYIEVPVEELKVGMVLDQGTFVARTTTYYQGRVNPNTWEIWFTDGTSYIETRGAAVRFRIDRTPDLMTTEDEAVKRRVLQSQIIHPAWTPEDHAAWLDDKGYAVPPVEVLTRWMREHVQSGAVADGRSRV